MVWELESSPEQLWPYAADNQRFNQTAGFKPVDYRDIPQKTGGSKRIAQIKIWKYTVEYEDRPFEWIRYQRYSNERIFKTGPIHRMYFEMILEPHGTGTKLHYNFKYTPKNLISELFIKNIIKPNMYKTSTRIFKNIDEYLQNETRLAFATKPPKLGDTAEQRLQTLGQQVIAEGYNSQWVETLIDLIKSDIDLNLTRLRPYQLADRWSASRRSVLEMFLSATKLGLLNMNWEVMCPLCRGGKQHTSTLGELQKTVHCSTCNINFEADFSQYVELTFTPHPQIRFVPINEYCAGSPMVTPHILAHQILAPKESRTIAIKLESGNYRLRTQKQGVEKWFNLQCPNTTQSSDYTVELSSDEIVLMEQASTNNKVTSSLTNFTLTNQADYEQRFFLEQGDWYTDAVTAAEVTALQHFRDLFSDEVLRPGDEIGIQGLTILFSDLVGSTAMYNQQGDASSYALVRKQFDYLQEVVRLNGGTIVKTIGDAIMAVFSTPASGVGAAYAIQKGLADFNNQHTNKPIMIKLGLHYGPCIAVNMNGLLDYFGTTVNLAARLEGQSKGGDIVISTAVWEDTSVQSLITDNSIMVKPFQTKIKGFDESFHLYRLLI